jgi:hypothetical protein
MVIEELVRSCMLFHQEAGNGRDDRSQPRDRVRWLAPAFAPRHVEAIGRPVLHHAGILEAVFVPLLKVVHEIHGWLLLASAVWYLHHTLQAVVATSTKGGIPADNRWYFRLAMR